MEKIPTSKNVAALFLYSPPKRESQGNEMNIWSTGSTHLSSLNMWIMRLFLLSALQKRRDDNTGFSSAMSKTGWGGFPNPGHPQEMLSFQVFCWVKSVGAKTWPIGGVKWPHHQLVGTSKGWGKYQLRPLDRSLKPWSWWWWWPLFCCSRFRWSWSWKLKARLVGKKMWWSLDFCFTSFWKLPFQRV